MCPRKSEEEKFILRNKGGEWWHSTIFLCLSWKSCIKILNFFFFLNTTGVADIRLSRSHRQTTTVPSEPSDGYYAIARCRLLTISDSPLGAATLCDLVISGCRKYHAQFSDESPTGFSFKIYWFNSILPVLRASLASPGALEVIVVTNSHSVSQR